MKRASFSVLFFIKKTKLLKDGEAPIRLRITVNSISVELQIRRSVALNLWSQAKECSMGRTKAAATERIYPHAQTAGANYSAGVGGRRHYLHNPPDYG